MLKEIVIDLSVITTCTQTQVHLIYFQIQFASKLHSVCDSCSTPVVRVVMAVDNITSVHHSAVVFRLDNINTDTVSTSLLSLLALCHTFLKSHNALDVPDTDVIVC